MLLFWFKKARVILGQIWWSFLFFGRAYFISLVYTLTLLVNSTENGGIFVNLKICHNFIFTLILSSILSLVFKSRLHLIFLAHSPFNYKFLLFCIFSYYYYYIIIIIINFFKIFLSFHYFIFSLFSLSSLFLPSPTTPPTSPFSLLPILFPIPKTIDPSSLFFFLFSFFL